MSNQTGPRRNRRSTEQSYGSRRQQEAAALARAATKTDYDDRFFGVGLYLAITENA